jgi:restriction system protein
MARKNQSVFESLFDVAAQLPWWLSVIFALFSYIGISIYENSIHYDSQNASIISKAIVINFLPLIKWLVVATFLLGAAVSLFNQFKRRNLLTNTASSSNKSSLNKMSWLEFEQLTHEIFRQRGYWVTETPVGADGGIDLVLEKNGEKTFVQCKQWKVQKVGVKVIRELYGVMTAANVKSGIVITSGEYTPDAKDFARKSNIVLINGDDLFEMIRSVNESKTELSTVTQEHTVPLQSPSCPKCGSQMVKRVAKQGKLAGNTFWGCSTYPKCRGIVAID